MMGDILFAFIVIVGMLFTFEYLQKKFPELLISNYGDEEE
tara:strand:- start:330 stop:449 length:120 start_codon:yes stop_codon:yes gene_type:complete